MLVYLIDVRPERYVAFDFDGVDEVTAIVYQNLTDAPWPGIYSWKNQSDELVTIPAQTAESSIGIPPGQRKFITGQTKPGTNSSSVDSELARVSG
jgi:hypothetical protein